MAADPVTGLLNIGNTLVNKFFKDKDLSAKLEHDEEMKQLVTEMQSTLGQLEINKEAAKHSSIFVAGARPFIMWTCGVALAYAYILYPLMKFAVVVAMDAPPELPTIAFNELMPVLMGLLGLGGMRSWEKGKGVARRNMSE